MSQAAVKTKSTLFAKAVALQTKGDIAAAADIYEQIDHAIPDIPEVLLNLALIRRQEKRIDVSESLFVRLLTTSPNFPKAHLNYGVLKISLKQYRDSLQCFDRALALDPKYASAWAHRGLARLHLREYHAALADVDHALGLDPNLAVAHIARGDVLTKLSRSNEAIASYQAAIKLNPKMHESYSGLGACLIAQGDYQAALHAINRAIVLNPASAIAYCNRGNWNYHTKNFASAVEDFRKAVKLDPALGEAWSNLGNALAAQGEYPAAESAFEQAKTITKGGVEGEFNRALLHLTQERFDTGWELYEYRRVKDKPTEFLRTSKPEWDGVPQPHKRLFIWSEQGVGDDIFFGTLLQKVTVHFAAVIVQVDDRLKAIFSRSIPNCRVIGRSDQISEDEYDFQIPSGSLPRIMVRSTADLPETPGYLTASSERADNLRKALERYPRPWIGISWISKNANNGLLRSMTLENIASVFAGMECTLVSLQYGDEAKNLAEQSAKHGFVACLDHGVDQFRDLDGLAALVSQCDAVVSIDNSTVHLAGALGVECFTMLSKPADWRWGAERNRSGWYQSLHLLRQEKTFDWKSVIHKVREALVQRFDGILSVPVTPISESKEPSVEKNVGCAVICPVGPGHEQAFALCRASIEAAITHSKGPFSHIEIIPVFDLDGKLGRSKARNAGIDKAAEAGLDWIYFIDADDFMTPYAFEDFAQTGLDMDAVWGMICEAPAGHLHEMRMRENQMPVTSSLADFLSYDPYYSLQMGHFIKTEIARKIRFDENLNAGEDFKYYLEVWKRYKAQKAGHVYFINCRGNHSVGPRSATPTDWRIAVDRMMTEAREAYLGANVAAQLN